jgi:hypothetical protein
VLDVLGLFGAGADFSVLKALGVFLINRRRCAGRQLLERLASQTAVSDHRHQQERPLVIAEVSPES